MEEARGLAKLMNTQLEYVLLASDGEGDYTPFQGFGDGVTAPSFVLLIDILALLPASPFEIFDTKHSLVELRNGLGRKRSSIVGPALFADMQAERDWSNCIPVIIGVADDIDKINLGHVHPHAILVSNEPRPGSVCVFGHDVHITQLLDEAIRDKWAKLLPAPLRRQLLDRPLRAPLVESSVMLQATGAAVPNELLCMALGHSFSGAKPVVSSDPEKYVDAILSTAERARTFIGKASTDIVLYAPSILRHLYAFDDGMWNQLFRLIPSMTVRNIIKNGVFRNKGYSGFDVRIADPNDLPNPYTDPVASELLRIRQTELRLSTAGVTALAASGTQPALRLPNAVNFNASVLREIELHVKRNDPRGQRLLQSSYRKLVESLSTTISPRIIDYVQSRAEAITLVDRPAFRRHPVAIIDGNDRGVYGQQQAVHV